MTRVLGLDLSLAATGLALIDTDDRLVVDTWTHGTKPGPDTITGRLTRLDAITSQVTCLDRIDLVVIEGPSLGQRAQSGTFERAGLWWLTVNRLDQDGVRVVEVPPSTLKRYATGKGNASKDAVLLAVARRYPHVDVKSNDEADALVLAAMGARHLGAPVDDLPKGHLAAMDAVAWTTKEVA
ncbi:hypothetical protein [Phycicoccus jejuensis]|uniref:hypothetical protein n=1 Tax=Phycicoccus jejuensis TaxID=367299 RepID=UPI00068F5CF1|nr:hypothetical protein [Phycicoccus jejuensis]